MKKINTAKEMMLRQLRTLYDGDKVVYQTLPNLRKSVQTEELAVYIDEIIEGKLRQQHRMEIIFTILKEESDGVVDDVIRCIAKSQSKLVNQCVEPSLSETMTIAASREMTTHQLNGYQTAVICSARAGFPDITRLLKRALQEEKAIVLKLKTIEDDIQQVPVTIRV